MVSRETPSQNVPSFDHRVTQCRSTVKVSVGKSRNDFQSHRRRTFVPSSITNSHWSSAMRGVGPADKTGKSVVRYCPGGSFASASLRRPEKPREIIPIYTSPYLIQVSDSFANPPFSMTDVAIRSTPSPLLKFVKTKGRLARILSLLRRAFTLSKLVLFVIKSRAQFRNRFISLCNVN